MREGAARRTSRTRHEAPDVVGSVQAIRPENANAGYAGFARAASGSARKVDGDARGRASSPHTSNAVFFFFQAEDGIRYDLVTGVQTCALPISSTRSPPARSISIRRSPSARSG